ncbi:MAG: thermonuclease family protein [Pseudomonadota bacterium]
MSPLASGVALLLAAMHGDVYVADGATLVISGTPVQMAGIDVPHLGSSDGDLARAELRTILEGQLVMCRSTGERAGARVFAYCQVDGADIGAEMVARGYALDCAIQSQGRYRELEPADSRDRLVQSARCVVLEGAATEARP